MRRDIKIKTKDNTLFEYNNKVHIKKHEYKYVVTTVLTSLSTLGGSLTVLIMFFTYLVMPFSYIEMNIALAKEFFNKDSVFNNHVEIDVDWATYF